MKIQRTLRVVLASALALLLLVTPTTQAQPDQPEQPEQTSQPEQPEQTSQSKQPECVAGCVEEYAPVCDENGMLYSNKCFYDYAACLQGIVDPPEPIPLKGDENSCPNEGPLGGVASIDEPSEEPFSWPPIEDDGSSSSSGSSFSSSSGDGDSEGDNGEDDDPVYQLPPNVVIDDDAPSAANFVPVTPAPTASGPVQVVDDSDSGSGDEEVIGGTADVKLDEDMIGGTADLDVDDFHESAKWEGDDNSSSSSSSSSGSGDGEVDDDGADDDGSNGGNSANAACEIMCADVFDPVCASNNVTYSNRCKLAVAQCQDPSVEPAYRGECGSNELPTPDLCAFECPMTDSPVCSADGHIYTNQCTYSSSLCRDPTLGEATAELCPHDQ